MRKRFALAATFAITATSALAQEGYPGPNAVTVVMMAFDIRPNGGYEVREREDAHCVFDVKRGDEVVRTVDFNKLTNRIQTLPHMNVSMPGEVMWFDIIIYGRPRVVCTGYACSDRLVTRQESMSQARTFVYYLEGVQATVCPPAR